MNPSDQQDRVRAMFYGIHIGDSLGFPVECFTAERIANEYGRVTEYKVPNKHKWFDGQPAGGITDDTQISLAVAESLIEAGTLDLKNQAEHHVNALRETTNGWGNGTRNAVRNLANGGHWKTSGTPDSTGNGVAMKMATIGAWLNYIYRTDPEKGNDELFKLLCDFGAMTHRTDLAINAGLTIAVAVSMCLGEEQDIEDIPRFLCIGANAATGLYNPTEDVLVNPISYLVENYKGMSTQDIITKFNGGTCYCFNSVPFALAFFLRNPRSIEALYDVVNAGGDTDSNGSMVGAMLGAVNGMKIFPEHLIEGMRFRDRVEDVATRFVNKFFS